MKCYRLLLPGFFLLACTTTHKQQGSPTSKNTYTQTAFDKEGHRGCRGLMPENTIPAMMRALGWGVTTLEMDVVISKDNKVVLSHDPFFSHDITTKPDGQYVTAAEEASLKLYGLTYDEIRQYDVGLKPHPRFPRQEKIKVSKPLLSDLIDTIQHFMLTARRPFPYYNIETKTTPKGDGTDHPAPGPFVELLMQVILSRHIEDYVIIQSFDFRTLQYLHEHYPAIKTSMLIDNSDTRTLDEQLKALGFVPTVYSPAYQLVNESLVQHCHDRSMRIIPWTINTKEEIARYKDMGVDGIITDYPDLF